METQFENSRSSPLPITRDLRLLYTLSTLIAILMAALSLGGLLFSSVIYPEDEFRQTYLPNDLVNLLIGVPILFGSMWLARRGRLVGLLCWPGALLYVLYNYIAYVFGLPFRLITLGFLALVLVSAYGLAALLQSFDRETIAEQLSGGVPVKTSGWVLVVFGIAFSFRAGGMIVEANLGQTTLLVSELGVLIADILLSVLWVAGGVLLLRRQPLGYNSGMGLLFVGSMLFIGLIAFLLLQPILTSAAFAMVDVIVVFVMGLFCFIPFVLFVRGVESKRIR